MATRSTIAIRNADGTITGVYCHNDGYLDWNGQHLLDYYNSEERARALIALGNLSSLRPTIEAPEGHSFDTPAEDATVAYHRDRGEKFSQLKAASYGLFHKYFEEYNYVWDAGRWNVSYNGRPPQPLEDAIAEGDEG